ncbi:UNVERIFIED_CONTAM: hypothetical protein RMT77_003904 [Armadillidium vulgare]
MFIAAEKVKMESKVFFCLIYILALFKDNLGSPQNYENQNLRTNERSFPLSHSYPYQLQQKIFEDLNGRSSNRNPFGRQLDLETNKMLINLFLESLGKKMDDVQSIMNKAKENLNRLVNSNYLKDKIKKLVP